MVLAALHSLWGHSSILGAYKPFAGRCLGSAGSDHCGFRVLVGNF